ncbi:hypothetical protein IW261DRAFT_1565835 [Armillaria novae-zelandiae]|uniref:Uncharacterized protein n=1 Tax=Armillaria novae-zelandiae TaxID=153914 RepID=A0AA39P4P8_9AGAR|nr:hypothetical protein IW261DRAFT_1565835 [Armillaria novae-zelandiae]
MADVLKDADNSPVPKFRWRNVPRFFLGHPLYVNASATRAKSEHRSGCIGRKVRDCWTKQDFKRSLEEELSLRARPDKELYVRACSKLNRESNPKLRSCDLPSTVNQRRRLCQDPRYGSGSSVVILFRASSVLCAQTNPLFLDLRATHNQPLALYADDLIGPHGKHPKYQTQLDKSTAPGRYDDMDGEKRAISFPLTARHITRLLSLQLELRPPPCTSPYFLYFFPHNDFAPIPNTKHPVL